MNIATWAIRRPVPPLALFLVLCIVGVVSFVRLPVTQFPNIDVPIITVSVTQPGAAPAEMASQIVKPIESAVSDVVGVKHVTAVATDSSANLTIEFLLETDTDRALNDIKDAVAGVRDDLPEEVTEPIVKRLDVTGLPILTYAVSDPTRSIEDLSYFVDEVVARDLQAVGGVGRVARVGGADREIKVELEPDRLRALGITAADVSSQLRAINIDLGGGRGELAGREFSIRALGGADTVEELAETPITLPSGRTVRLNALGAVIDGAAEARAFALYDGQPVVAFSVRRATGASDLDAAEAVKVKLDRIREAYPNVSFSLIDDMTVYTEDSFDSAMETLYEGAALAVLVVLLFLRDWRATIITAVALPLSIIPTFFVMELLGFSLNTISLLGITLVTGILVDDAIVEIENIARHIRMGSPAYEASEAAATEIGLAVIAISFSIVAVFAPVSFMGGIAGQYFKQFGLTVAVAVLFSLLVARLITPMMAAYFMKDGGEREAPSDGRLMRAYLAALRWTLRHRALALGAGVAIFAVSIFSATLLPTEFIPSADTGRTNISVELPPGSTLDEARLVTHEISDAAHQIPEVGNVFVNGGADGIATANVTVNFGRKDERERSSSEILDDLAGRLAGIPDVRLHMLNDNGARDISISVLADTEAAASRAASSLADAMDALGSVVDPTTSAALLRPEIRITPKPELAAEMGVTAAALASTVRIATIGDIDANLAKFNTGERRIPIVVRLKEAARRDLMRLSGQHVPSTTGGPVPLAVVADLALGMGPSAIERYDRQYRVSVEADLADGALLGPTVAEIHALPVAGAMPEGASIQSSGDAEVMTEVFTSFGLAMGAGALLVYVVLVLLFSSFITPLTILLSLPLAIGGAIFALYLNGSAIGLSVVIGFLMLMGIVTKNAIMLVEFTIQAMKDGADRRAAVLDAGHKRARPIIMTTIAMTAGMTPSALALGPGGEFRSPMALAVIGGLVLSTLLSLLFVPVLFSVVDGAKLRAGRFLTAGLGANRPRSG
ncbi:efflux RND transporter permease subunit [Pikeienuella sp. HZG-20]|uniref:efflux RND transporter permease subunit n=1 Tax=Paludibacillus litoralis TaxID=3133267 RepID=UPI0030EC3265